MLGKRWRQVILGANRLKISIVKNPAINPANPPPRKPPIGKNKIKIGLAFSPLINSNKTPSRLTINLLLSKAGTSLIKINAIRKMRNQKIDQAIAHARLQRNVLRKTDPQCVFTGCSIKGCSPGNGSTTPALMSAFFRY